MIIVRLTGGLGNQLFQYAKAKYITKEKKTSLKIDTSWYKGRISRQYLLDDFSIDSKIANPLEVLMTKVFSKRNYIDTTEDNDWQSEKYLKKIENIARREFRLSSDISERNKEVLNEIKSTNSVSIHLRGTDYVTGNKSSFHGICSEEYYNKAIEYIKSKIRPVHFFIFTDDIDWAKKHIKFPEPYTIISDNISKPYEELYLMSQCKHNIIANSTFSWWSAWLNKNPDKIVITPRKWFNDNAVKTTDLIPQSWIQI